jgi:hypothetical protein
MNQCVVSMRRADADMAEEGENMRRAIINQSCSEAPALSV